MGKVLKVLFVADHLKFGGAERHLVSVATGLIKSGHKVSVAYLKPHEELVPALNDGGIYDLLSVKSAGGADISAIRRLSKHIKDFNPDILVVTSQYSLAMGYVAKNLSATKTKFLFVCHSADVVVRGIMARAKFLIYKPFYHFADHIIFVSEIQREFFKSIGIFPRRSEVIHNGVDIDYFYTEFQKNSHDYVRDKYGISRNDYVIGICAAFREEKRQIDLLRAIKNLKDRGFFVKSLLIGEGAMRHVIESKISEFGIQDQVIICGHQSDVRPYISACDVMALTSHTEAFPIATLESMAMGKPLIVTNVGGISEQVEHGVNGLIYPAGDISALIGCIEKFKDGRLRQDMGERGRDQVAMKFSRDKMINNFIDACSTTVKNNYFGGNLV